MPEEFKGSDQLIIGNGQGLIITHIGDACFNYKSFNSAYQHTLIARKDILLVPSIRKNLISISKLTTDNKGLFGIIFRALFSFSF